ncbi:MAG: phage holin family protein [Pseudomonadota bacterium]
MLTGIKQSAASAARKAGLFTGGLLCMAVGAGFLTVAAWILLTLAHGAMIAALVIGAAYFGLGLVLLGIAATRASSHSEAAPAVARPHAQQTIDAPPLMQAFLHGLQAGANAQQRPN